MTQFHLDQNISECCLPPPEEKKLISPDAGGNIKMNIIIIKNARWYSYQSDAIILRGHKLTVTFLFITVSTLISFCFCQRDFDYFFRVYSAYLESGSICIVFSTYRLLSW